VERAFCRQFCRSTAQPNCQRNHVSSRATAGWQPFNEEEFEFLEFKNSGDAALDLQGFTIADGVNFVFPSFVLNPGARILVVRNRAAFESRYGTGLPIAGEYVGQLDNAGELVSVTGPFGEPVLSFEYKDSWYPTTDGPGFSLVLADEAMSSKGLGERASWRAARSAPGQLKPAAQGFPAVVVSEALTRPGTGPAAIELHNLSPVVADISYWFLTDDFDTAKKFRIPRGTVVPPGSFFVVSENNFGSPGSLVPFSLDPLGGEIYLFSGDAATNLNGYVHGFKYGVQQTNVTFGRYVNSLGEEAFVSQITNTLGTTNLGPNFGGSHQ
jgi:hypothetical protein